MRVLTIIQIVALWSIVPGAEGAVSLQVYHRHPLEVNGTTSDAELGVRRRAQSQEPSNPTSWVGQTLREIWHKAFSFLGSGDDNSTSTTATTPSPLPPTPPLSTYASGQSGFHIDLSLRDVADVAPFQTARMKWTQIITGDLPDISGFLGGSSSCGAWPTFVDDIYICGKYDTIDGPGGVLGTAGPRHYRIKEGLPITGEMRFDLADISRPVVNVLGVILHEMGHVLGIGSMWTINGLTNGFNVPCNYKEDTMASRQYRTLTGCTGAVPLEQSYTIGGSNCAHWQESCFGDELMTPRATSFSLPISRITVGGLQDLGYQVNYGYSDVYNINCGCSGNTRQRQRLLRWGHNNTSVKIPGASTDNTTRALSNFSDTIYSHPTATRRLSDVGRAVVLNYGQKILAENKKATSLIQGPCQYPDLGRELVFVLYEENGVIHNVLVRAED